MISSPQGDVKHTGHVGLDGAYFGDISFLDPASCVSIISQIETQVSDLKKICGESLYYLEQYFFYWSEWVRRF